MFDWPRGAEGWREAGNTGGTYYRMSWCLLERLPRLDESDFSGNALSGDIMMGDGGWREAGKIGALTIEELGWCLLKRLPRLDEFD